MNTIRVLLADDHPLYRSGLRVLLETQPDTAIVAEAATGEQAVALVGETVPDVVIMDLSMPGAGGLSAIHTVTDTHPTTKVLALTMLDDPTTVAAAIRVGARGYLVKGAAGEDVLHAIRAVAAGHVVFDARVATDLLGSLNEGDASKPSHEPFPELTDRERDILLLISGGHTNASIARRLHLTDKTVRNYCTAIFRKLNVTSRVEAALRTRDAGL